MSMPTVRLHSSPNRIQCKKTAKAALDLCVLASQAERQAAYLRGRGAGAPLVQLIRKVILCFQYETFHTVKSNPKTSWIQSSHTFKHDFYLVLNRVQTTEDVTSKWCGRHHHFQLWRKEGTLTLNFFNQARESRLNWTSSYTGMAEMKPIL